LIVEPLFAEDLILLVHSSHPLAVRETMSLRELEDVPLLLPPKGAALRRVLDRAAGSVDVSLRAQAEIDGVRLLASLAFDGYGPAIVPATAAPKQTEGDFRRIMVPELPRRVVAWVRRRRPGPSAATNAVALILNEVVRTHADEQPGVHLTTDTFPLHRNV
jgi:DNA-binding transcriptional LysR family regulator